MISILSSATNVAPPRGGDTSAGPVPAAPSAVVHGATASSLAGSSLAGHSLTGHSLAGHSLAGHNLAGSRKEDRQKERIGQTGAAPPAFQTWLAGAMAVVSVTPATAASGQSAQAPLPDTATNRDGLTQPALVVGLPVQRPQTTATVVAALGRSPAAPMRPASLPLAPLLTPVVGSVARRSLSLSPSAPIVSAQQRRAFTGLPGHPVRTAPLPTSYQNADGERGSPVNPPPSGLTMTGGAVEHAALLTAARTNAGWVAGRSGALRELATQGGRSASDGMLPLTTSFASTQTQATKSPLPTLFLQHPNQATPIADLGALVARQVGVANATLRVQIHPADMGEILVMAAKTPAGVQVQLTATNPTTVAWLTQQADEISQAVRTNGVHLATLQVFAGASGDNGNGTGTGRRDAEDRPARSRRLTLRQTRGHRQIRVEGVRIAAQLARAVAARSHRLSVRV